MKDGTGHQEMADEPGGVALLIGGMSGSLYSRFARQEIRRLRFAGIAVRGRRGERDLIPASTCAEFFP